MKRDPEDLFLAINRLYLERTKYGALASWVVVMIKLSSTIPLGLCMVFKYLGLNMVLGSCWRQS